MAAANDLSEIRLELRELRKKEDLRRERFSEMAREANLRRSFIPPPVDAFEEALRIESEPAPRRFDRFVLMHGSRPRDAALFKMVKMQDTLPEDLRHIKVKIEGKKYKVAPPDILFGEEKRFIATDARHALLQRVIAKNYERDDILGDMGISPDQYIEKYMQPPLSMRYGYEGRLGELNEKIAMNISRGKKIQAKISDAENRLYAPFFD